MSALVYGRSGTGKTAFAATFPKPLLLVDIRERGTDTIANVLDVDVVQVNTWDELEELYWQLKNGYLPKYRTVVLDQITQLQDLGKSKIRDDGAKDDDEPMSKRDWGNLSGLMQTWLMNFRDLTDQGLNIVFVAHERTLDIESMEDQIDPSIGPRLMPSVGAALCGAVSAIGNTFIREEFIGPEKTRRVEYCLRIGPHAYYTTKVRHPVEAETPEYLVNPSYEKLDRAIRGEDVSKPVKRKISHEKQA
ncbi:MAG: ATP-binding protein [Chromatiaceae bacterium]|nr:ATP-binding protein [Candidatus Thioaporhodococcus sediminis]